MTTRAAGGNRRGRLAGLVPIDLAAVVAGALVVDALVFTSVGWPPITFVLGTAFLFFLPGYALLAALFPGRARRTTSDSGGAPQLAESHDGLVFSERLALSVGTSVALIPVVAVALGALGFGLTQTTILGSLTVVVLGGATVGAVRRARLAPDRRYVPFGRDPVRGDGGLSSGRGRRGSTVLAAGLAIAVVLAGGAFAYGLATEPASTPYTSAMLLTDDGDRHVASGYPANVSANDPIDLTLRVDNHRQQPTNVTAVVTLEQVADDGSVVQGDRLETLTRQLGPNERWNGTHEVAPTFAGEDLRLAYYLYHDGPPASVGSETADEELYLRIDVDE